MTQYRPHLALALLAAWPLVGCGGGADVHALVMRDSAGIRIVDNGAVAMSARDEWQVSAEPAVDIGVLEGAPEYQLFRVRDAVRLSDGRIVLVNSGTYELRFYDGDGRYLQTVGREGDGPGEFRSMGRLLPVRGDTLGVYDSGLRRLTWFSPRGAFLRSVSLGGGDVAVIPFVRGVFEDGAMLGTAAIVFRPGTIPNGVVRDSTAYLRVARDGTLDTLGLFPTTERYVGNDQRVFYVTTLPFGLTPASAVAADRFYYGTGRRPEVDLYDESGGLTRVVRWQQAARPVTPKDVEAAKARQMEDASDPNWRRRVEDMFADLPIPQAMPRYASLLVDAAGDLWVGAFVAPADTARVWRIFDPDGRLVGELSTPAALRVTQIGDDFLLGIWSDEMDVEHVRMFGLMRPGSPAG
jgi:hypothetical protein